MSHFSKRLLTWYDQQGRHDLPWQLNKTAYRVWVSEVMLQQTQVATVIDYFHRWMKNFPTVQSLANAEEDQVLALWAGLGYYTRARNLHRAAKMICSDFQGELPKDRLLLESLPGIGRSTAAAILSLSANIPEPILDGNVKRVFARQFELIGYPNDTVINKKFWSKVEDELSQTRPGDYNQALMDLGALICTRSNPKCLLCPVEKTCLAKKSGLIDQLPTRAPKKIRPEKNLFFLMIKNKAQEILLYKRPSQGIWGGLWSLPECENDHDVDFTLAQYFEHFRYSKKQLKTHPSFHHDFTHYRLHLTPIEMTLTDFKLLDNSEKIHWFSGSQHNIGLPAPIKQLLIK